VPLQNAKDQHLLSLKNQQDRHATQQINLGWVKWVSMLSSMTSSKSAGMIEGFGLHSVVGAEVLMGGAGGLGMRWAMRAAINAEVRSGGGVA